MSKSLQFFLLTIALLFGATLPQPALSFADSCVNIFSGYNIPSARSLRKLVIQFESSQQTRSSTSTMMAETILHQIERGIENAKLEDLLDFFEPETGLIPFMHRDLKLRRAVAKAIYNHPASGAERALFLKKIISENIDFDFFDELIGLNKSALEMAEDDAMRTAESAEKKKTLMTLGINENHDRWFSDHLALIGTLESARKLGAKTIVDLGCGTGRLGLLAGLLYPEIKFIGVDLYAPRVNAAESAARRWGIQDRIQFRVQDLLDQRETLPEGDFYFVFGPTTDIEINQRVVGRLKEVVQNKRVVVSSHHNLTTRLLFTQPWLYKLNSQNLPDGLLFTNIPMSEWLKSVKENGN